MGDRFDVRDGEVIRWSLSGESVMAKRVWYGVMPSERKREARILDFRSQSDLAEFRNLLLRVNLKYVRENLSSMCYSISSNPRFTTLRSAPRRLFCLTTSLLPPCV